MDDRKDFERHETIRQAVERADHIIMQASDADREELILLTALLCKEFAEKIIFMVKIDAERKRIAADLESALRLPKEARHSDWTGGDVRGPGLE